MERDFRIKVWRLEEFKGLREGYIVRIYFGGGI